MGRELVHEYIVEAAGLPDEVEAAKQYIYDLALNAVRWVDDAETYFRCVHVCAGEAEPAPVV